MQLLELPPEIFQRVTAHYVAKVGLCEAWKRREICSESNLGVSKFEIVNGG